MHSANFRKFRCRPPESPKSDIRVMTPSKSHHQLFSQLTWKLARTRFESKECILPIFENSDVNPKSPNLTHDDNFEAYFCSGERDRNSNLILDSGLAHRVVARKTNMSPNEFRTAEKFSETYLKIIHLSVSAGANTSCTLTPS